MIKEYFNTPIICRECHFKSISGIIMLLHLIIHHHKKISCGTIKWALRRGIEFRLLCLPFLLLWGGLMCICWPFWWVYENLGPDNWW